MVTWVSSCSALNWGLAQTAASLNQGDHSPVNSKQRLSPAGKLSIQEPASFGASLDSHATITLHV